MSLLEKPNRPIPPFLILLAQAYVYNFIDFFFYFLSDGILDTRSVSEIYMRHRRLAPSELVRILLPLESAKPREFYSFTTKIVSYSSIIKSHIR